MNALNHKLERYTSQRRGIYLIPNKRGVVFLALIFTIFYMGMSYANNIMLSFSFFLFAFFVVLLVLAHFNLYGHEWSRFQIQDAFAKENLTVDLAVNPRGIFPPRYINLKIKTDKEVLIFPAKSLENQYPKKLRFQLVIGSRGKRTIEKVTLTSSYPLGLFHVWHHLAFKQAFYIYPARDRESFIKWNREQLHDQPTLLFTNQGDFYQHENFLGDNYKRIDWKVYARSDQLWVKNHREFLQSDIEINWRDMPGSEAEEKLTLMSSIVDDCWRQGRSWSMVLPKRRYQQDSHYQHYINCLRGLSEFS